VAFHEGVNPPDSSGSSQPRHARRLTLSQVFPAWTKASAKFGASYGIPVAVASVGIVWGVEVATQRVPDDFLIAFSVGVPAMLVGMTPFLMVVSPRHRRDWNTGLPARHIPALLAVSLTWWLMCLLPALLMVGQVPLVGSHDGRTAA
jgi:hypothetical protein